MQNRETENVLLEMLEKAQDDFLTFISEKYQIPIEILDADLKEMLKKHELGQHKILNAYESEKTINDLYFKPL